MTAPNAYQGLIESYLLKRKVPASRREYLGPALLDELTADGAVADILNVPSMVSGSDMEAYIDTQALYLLAGRIKSLPENERNDGFRISREEWQELRCEYDAYLSYRVVESGQRGWGLDKNWQM